VSTSKTRADARNEREAKANQDSKAETGRESRSVPSGRAAAHDGSEQNATALNATHDQDSDERPENVAMARDEQSRALGDVALPGDDTPDAEKREQHPDDSAAPDLTQNVDRDGDFRKPEGVEGGRVDDAATRDDEQRAAERARVQASRMPAVGSAEGARSIFPEELLRAAYNELKEEVPSLSWDKFNRALQHSARIAHTQGHPVTDEDGTG
jgi:hypothetical protein